MKTFNDAISFFYDHAGYAYPKGSTTEQADACRLDNAHNLATAEDQAYNMGLAYEWMEDGGTNRDWTDDGEETPTWECIAWHNENSVVVSSGHDFGDEEPSGPYKRVVEAELALEFMETLS